MAAVTAFSTQIHDDHHPEASLFRRRREGLLLARGLRKNYEVAVGLLHQIIAHGVERSLQLGQV